MARAPAAGPPLRVPRDANGRAPGGAPVAEYLGASQPTRLRVFLSVCCTVMFFDFTS